MMKFPKVEAIKKELERRKAEDEVLRKAEVLQHRIHALPIIMEGKTTDTFEMATRALRTQAEQFNGETKAILLNEITAVCDGIVVENGFVMHNSVRNLQQFESRIRNADMAKEMIIETITTETNENLTAPEDMGGKGG